MYPFLLNSYWMIPFWSIDLYPIMPYQVNHYCHSLLTFQSFHHQMILDNFLLFSGLQTKYLTPFPYQFCLAWHWNLPNGIGKKDWLKLFIRFLGNNILYVLCFEWVFSLLIWYMCITFVNWKKEEGSIKAFLWISW